MAGKFLTLEEAARHLGVTIEEINRLVDRKKLFPMRDGATVKFKLDEIERVAADGDDDAGDGSGLTLDLSSPSLGGPTSGIGDIGELQLDDAGDDADSIFSDQGSKVKPPSGTIVRGDAKPLDGGSALASSDLDFDSIIAASSPSLPKPANDSNVAGGSGTLAIDLSNLGSGPAALGSGLGLSGPSLADPLGTSGISLEGDDLAGSGIDLSSPGLGGGSVIGSGIGGSAIGGSVIGSGIGGSGSLTGEAFELGADGGDDDSASVVIGTEEGGDGSLFGIATDDSSESISMSDDMIAPVVSGEDMSPGEEGFNALQITGLVCTAILLLICCMVMLDLVWAIPSPGGTPVSSPLLKALTDTFAWK